MNEYEVFFIGNNGKQWSGFFYGRSEKEAKFNAVKVGAIPVGKITGVSFKEPYRGYGHV